MIEVHISIDYEINVARWYKMEISAEKTNSANGIQREIKVKWQKLGTLTSFK